MAWSRHRFGQTPSPHGDLVRLLISSPLQTPTELQNGGGGGWWIWVGGFSLASSGGGVSVSALVVVGQVGR